MNINSSVKIILNNLEKLNSQIDVWIDEENYIDIFGPNGVTLSDSAKSNISKCFPNDGVNCTNQNSGAWQRALSYGENALPVVKGGGYDLKAYGNQPIIKSWAHLLYAKSIRAKIQERNYSDCYVRRLDDVIAYLERHLPNLKIGRKDTTDSAQVFRLTILFLLELSACALDWEAMGYSDRARRIILEARQFSDDRAPYEFYELWARYNIGVAYFHLHKYRLAVLEFNRIIWQYNEWKRGPNQKVNKNNLMFFESNKGKELLLKPSIMYRAEVQLKLQLAYHALSTLEKLDAVGYKGIRVSMLRAQAYQQLGRLDRSWEALAVIYQDATGHHIGTRREFISGLKSSVSRFPRYSQLEERFWDVLIEDQLNWVKCNGSDPGQKHLQLASLVQNQKSEAGSYVKYEVYKSAVDEDRSYLAGLATAFSTIYSELIQSNRENRRGYYQQLAEYLGWLTKVTKLPNAEKEKEHIKDIRKEMNRIKHILDTLYQANRLAIIKEDDWKSISSSKCPYCKKGIALQRINREHYEWFTDAMFEFYANDKWKDDRKEFVKRLLKLERLGNNLRIQDLELRYKYYGATGLTHEFTGIEAKDRCWDGIPPNKRAYLGLLKCDGHTDETTVHLYQTIMEGWDRDFLRQIQYPSIHDSHENGFYYIGLQRWNSSSPAKGYSVGGGYLLYHLDDKRQVDLGIAIDPGFDFVRNLFHSGFSLDDIDIVLISHAHLDHIRDFESIVTLLYELRKMVGKKKRIHVILSLGAYKRLEHIVEHPTFRYFVEPYIIDIDREIDDEYFHTVQFASQAKVSNKPMVSSLNEISRFKALLPKENQADCKLLVKVAPKEAFHYDGTDSDSFGFVIEMVDFTASKKMSIKFGYTGDTKWIYPEMPDPQRKKGGRKFRDIIGQYEECDVLLIHLGSLIKRNDDRKYSFADYGQCTGMSGPSCERLVQKANHPYLIGMLRLLSDLYNKNVANDGESAPLILVSEFGEELRGNIRYDMVYKLRNIYGERMALLPVDVGVNVFMRSRNDKKQALADGSCLCQVWCVQCRQFVDIAEADFRMYGNDHALYCVCSTCCVATPSDVLKTTLSKLYDVGVDIRTTN